MASENMAYERGSKILKNGDEDSIYLLSSEEDVFTSWYLRYVEQPTSNKLPIAVPLLQYPWYVRNALGTLISSEVTNLTVDEILLEIMKGASQENRKVYVGDANIYDLIRESMDTKTVELIHW
jgi:hypothetical protein